MVIINLRFGHENSIFSLNNFIPVSWGSSNCTNSVVCLFLFSLVVARAHFFPCCWCAVQCADINQHIFESRHWKWNGTKKISWQLQVYDSKWRDDASWFDAAPGSKQRTSAHRNSTKMISQLNSMIVLGVRYFHTKGVMAKTTSNRTSAQHTHTHSPFRLWWRMFLHNLFDANECCTLWNEIYRFTCYGWEIPLRTGRNRPFLKWWIKRKDENANEINV